MKRLEDSIRHAIAEGINKIGWAPDVPNSKGEMLFGSDCHEVFVISEQVLKVVYEERQLILDFASKYYNPKDTTFRSMIDDFQRLSEEQKTMLIDLCAMLRKMRE